MPVRAAKDTVRGLDRLDSNRLCSRLMNAILWLPGVLIPILFVVLFIKRRRRSVFRSAFSDDSKESPIIGNMAERESGEKELRELPLDLRELYSETMDIQRRYSTRRGYTADQLEVLVDRLRDNDIQCVVHFQPSGPLGFGDSIITQQGEFELFVKRTNMRLAERWIAEWEQQWTGG